MALVVVIGKIHERGIEVLETRRGIDVEQMGSLDEAGMCKAAERADAILIRTSRLSKAAIEGAKRLKVVARHGVGYDNIDVEALTMRGIPLALVGNVNSISVAEHALYLLLACMKDGMSYDRAMRRGAWSVRDSLGARDLSGKTLLIVGFGRIGREVAARAKAFGMKISAYDPWVSAIGPDEQIRFHTDLQAAVKEADAVSLHLPLTPGTAKLFSRALIETMKPDAVLVCTARGGLIDETALAEALKAGRLKAAGLDVFETEPPPLDHPLFGLDTVILSPHSAALTDECAQRMAVVSAQNCLDGLDGRLNPALLANPEVLGGT
ncbi:MAG TPA: hydroxyacid dehydrogenase [Aestuariivirgaceae bacterium]